MNLRTHLAKMHTHLAEHSLVKARHHEKLSQHYGQLADAMRKADMGDGDDENTAADCHAEIADAHKALSDHYVSEGEYHADCAKSMNKAEADDELEKRFRLTPDDIVGVIPDNVRAVPRHGAPELGGLVDTSTVDPALRKFVQVDATDTD